MSLNKETKTNHYTNMSQHIPWWGVRHESPVQRTEAKKKKKKENSFGDCRVHTNSLREIIIY